MNPSEILPPSFPDPEGVALLKADLRANARHYMQNSFGEITAECGTECCMAGLCLMRELGGEAAFTERLRRDTGPTEYERFTNECVAAGVRQLGLGRWREGEGDPPLPPIFDMSFRWPADLARMYAAAASAHDHAAMAEAACAALDRIDGRGCFLEVR